MAYDPRKHHRRSIRLRGYDYARGGAYYITVCTQNKACIFGQIVEGEMIVDEAGRVIQEIWDALPQQFATLVLDAFQVMPTHLHAVFVLPGPGLEPALANAVGAPVIQPSLDSRGRACPPLFVEQKNQQIGDGKPSPYKRVVRIAGLSTGHQTSMGGVVGAFKSIATITVNKLLGRTGTRLLHENFYEHIIRDVDELEVIRDYIIQNPARWQDDPENPNNL